MVLYFCFVFCFLGGIRCPGERKENRPSWILFGRTCISYRAWLENCAEQSRAVAADSADQYPSIARSDVEYRYNALLYVYKNIASLVRLLVSASCLCQHFPSSSLLCACVWIERHESRQSHTENFHLFFFFSSFFPHLTDE